MIERIKRRLFKRQEITAKKTEILRKENDPDDILSTTDEATVETLASLLNDGLIDKEALERIFSHDGPIVIESEYDSKTGQRIPTKARRLREK